MDDEKVDVDDIDDVEDKKPATVEEVTAELERTKRALARANKEAERRRLDAKSKEKEDAAKGPSESETKAVSAAKKAAATSALLRAGFAVSGDDDKDEASMARAVRLLDLDSATLDSDSGRVDGLKDMVADLKEDFPAMFAEKPAKDDKKVTVKRSSGATPDKKPPTSTERLAALIIGDKK